VFLEITLTNADRFSLFLDLIILVLQVTQKPQKYTFTPASYDGVTPNKAKSIIIIIINQ